MAYISDRDMFFTLYLLQARFADNGAYSHTDLVRRSDGETVIENCWNAGAKETEEDKSIFQAMCELNGGSKMDVCFWEEVDDGDCYESSCNKKEWLCPPKVLLVDKNITED